MSRFLVTGGCGFIGSHLVDSLVADGHDVVVLDDLSTGQRGNLTPHAELVVGDIRDQDVVHRLMGDVDGCFHLAAVASVERSNEAWLECHQVNISGAINIFDAARATGDRGPVPVVYASSAAVYGDNAAMPLNELAGTQPLTAYGADKLSCELHGRVAWLVHRVPTTGLRFFNVYGPRQDPASPYSGVISIFMDKVLRNQPLTVLGDGEQCRDFIHVSDVVRFVRKAMETSHEGCRALNVCTGRMVSINQLAGTIARVAGASAEIKHAPPRKGDIRVSLGDPTRAGRALGIKADVDLGDGIKDTLSAINAVREAA